MPPRRTISIRADLFANARLQLLAERHGPIIWAGWLALRIAADEYDDEGAFLVSPKAIAGLLRIDSLTAAGLMHMFDTVGLLERMPDGE